MKVVVIFFVALCNLSSGILLPGSCPKLRKPTDDIRNMSMSFIVVGKVPYSEHFHSYLFGRRIYETCSLIILYPKLGYSDKRDGLREKCPVVQASLNTLLEENNQVEANFSLTSFQTGKFGPVVTEFLHFDIYERELYLWSCQEFSENYHDIGLLVLLEIGQELDEALIKVKNRIVRYFHNSVVNAITWEREREESETGNGIFCRKPTTCIPAIYSVHQNRDTAWIPVVVLILVFIVRLFACHCQHRSITCPRNRVDDLR